MLAGVDPCIPKTNMTDTWRHPPYRKKKMPSQQHRHQMTCFYILYVPEIITLSPDCSAVSISWASHFLFFAYHTYVCTYCTWRFSTGCDVTTRRPIPPLNPPPHTPGLPLCAAPPARGWSSGFGPRTCRRRLFGSSSRGGGSRARPLACHRVGSILLLTLVLQGGAGRE